ncbi:OmpA family protein [Pelomonas sp. KK5]|uniref:OmpA family protein n=1 Tax=Pelomonas sp. KK5 TaxID=1855730 RepID=UPI00097BDC2A|nr:OmpA family protein [Pelomonas sp. KK5]
MKTTTTKIIRSLALAGASLTLSLSAFAQAASAPAAAPVLKGSQVTEQALIDALAIEGPEAQVGATRGFKAANRTGNAAPAANKPAAAGKASLLITFGTNSAELTGESAAALDVLARALQSDALAGFSFKVEGHADARGDAEANRKLSQLRAESVASYLVSHAGLLPERLTPVGKGSSEPMNKGKVDAPENRRVTIVTVRN